MASERSKSEAYPSKEYFSSMREIANAMTSKKELSEYSDLLKLNYALRDVFLNHLAEIFANFEAFVVLGTNSSDNSEGSGNSGLQAFDKVGFLSDCPETHMAFLRCVDFCYDIEVMLIRSMTSFLYEFIFFFQCISRDSDVCHISGHSFGHTIGQSSKALQ